MEQRAEAPMGTDERARKVASERAEALQGFYIHLLVYLTVNTGLFLINLFTKGDGGGWWFYWPLLGWGIGMLIHGLATFGGVFSNEWRDRKAEEFYQRGRRERG